MDRAPHQRSRGRGDRDRRFLIDGTCYQESERSAMKFFKFFSPCWFGHGELIKEVREGKLHLVCFDCQQDTGMVLQGQTLKVKQSTGKIVMMPALRSRRSK
jgi:hypothetical protein